MGKLKKGRRNQRARHNPIGKKGQNGVSDGGEAKKDETTRNNRILPLIEKLSSSSTNDRSMALGAITVLCEDNRMRKLLLKEKLVQIIMEQCLNDNSDEVVVEAFGLLRNIGIDEGYDILKYYWRSNIWITIENSLKKVQESFKYLQQPPSKELTKKQKEDEKSKQQLLFDFTEHLLSLVVVIASGSDDLYDMVFEKLEPVLNLAIDLINFNISSNKLSIKLFNTLLDFIYEFCSESNEFIQKLATSNFSLESVNTFVHSESQKSNNLGKAYVGGITFHINEVMKMNSSKNQVCHKILSSLFNNLTTIDLEQLKSDLNSKDNANEPLYASAPEITQDIDQQIAGSSAEKDLAKANLQNIEIVLDLTTSVFEYLAINENFEEPPELSPELIELIFKVIVPSIIELIKFNQANENILSLSDKLIVCLNNLAWLLLSSESLPVEWFNVSSAIWDLTIEVSQTDDELLQKDCLNLLWAITKALGPEIKSKIDPQMINQLIQKCNDYISDWTSGNFNPDHLEYYLAIIGFSGSVAIIIDNTTVTYQISEFLLRTIEVFISVHNLPAAVELVLESLNLIFEIFGDKSYAYDNEIYVQKQYNQRLRQYELPAKEMYKKIDKHKYAELKIKGEETFINIGRFIQYKESEQ
ncbi:hypothetical protein PSN45_003054 [Yamadazyma tenuis]|uniref:SYO1-like TPR repeats domain-containing protein n=1 Tax=Candida tenuis (strain ATCC 10573 / BCRC 21748 / CBS 615 / JCM 9827 / NBRC 10315 / NRRL Y-1498 / VKM Y-70) TaxID=590646 RepID=G3AXC4_CANTC|nr:uncharacterized protein CANTEDRAFT_100766 [Yamadazyma tenuis ATCC 10573]EGV66338.1 hypothetical protein CANTEDRAFT_100766 [Yamadazyma tenuis ATCC 10573]WEJ95534.1 hypothetical protein PSN45_003054 [Yamadazyma tenuis]